MPHDWIIEVLDDLKTYARENKLDALALQIEDARLVALTEIASKPASVHDHSRLMLAPSTRAD